MSQPTRPRLEGLPTDEKIRLLTAYVDAMTEELLFRLDHIGADNLCDGEISKIKEKLGI